MPDSEIAGISRDPHAPRGALTRVGAQSQFSCYEVLYWLKIFDVGAMIRLFNGWWFFPAARPDDLKI